MNNSQNNRVDCYQCVHFTVTWEPKTPKACKLFGFKSATLPSVAVYQSTGQVCLGFEAKQSLKNQGRS